MRGPDITSRVCSLDCREHSASRRMSRAPRREQARVRTEGIARVRCNIWQDIPLCDATVDLAMSVFAPRNTDELARVLRPNGALIVATPAPEHLQELATLHAVSVHRTKAMRLQQLFAGWPSADPVQRVSWTLQLTQADTKRVLTMGPAAHHLRRDFSVHLTALGEPVSVTAAVELRTFRNPCGTAPTDDDQECQFERSEREVRRAPLEGRLAASRRRHLPSRVRGPSTTASMTAPVVGQSIAGPNAIKVMRLDPAAFARGYGHEDTVVSGSGDGHLHDVASSVLGHCSGATRRGSA